jgi:hypothetical protein
MDGRKVFGDIRASSRARLVRAMSDTRRELLDSVWVFFRGIISRMFALLALVLLQFGSWSSISPMPEERQEVGVAAVEGRVYVVGGIGSNQRGTGAVHFFDTRTHAWAPASRPSNRKGLVTTPTVRAPASRAI